MRKYADAIEEFRPAASSFSLGCRRDLLHAGPLLGVEDPVVRNDVAEARWLAARGVDAIIAQGLEAGGHRAISCRTI